MRSRLMSSTSLLLAATVTGIAPSAVLAQAVPAADAPAAAKAADNNLNSTSSEIIVTAQRRPERLFDVPLTVHVITGEEIERQNLGTLRDIIEHSPQVNFQQTGDQRTDTLSIRGISSVSNAAGVEPDAAIVIDGETLARTMEMNYDAIDIERTEILEGPQGTLFGKNAVAVLINITTKGPKLDNKISGTVKTVIAEDDEYRLKGNINIPLSDTTALYINAYGEYKGGWAQNVHPGQPNGGQEHGAGIRAQFLYQPDDSFSLVLKGEYTNKVTGIIPYAFKELSEADVIQASKDLSGGTAMVAQFNALLSNSGINLVSSSGVSTPIINGTKSYLYDDRTWSKVHSYAFSATAKKDLGAATLHYLGTYRYYNLYSNDNEYGVSAPQLTNSPFGLDTLDYAGPSREQTVQQELRVESNGSGPLDFVAGAFYYYNDNYHHETAKTCNDAVYGYYNGAGYPNPNPINPVDNFQCTGGYVGHYTTYDFVTRIKTNNEAVFGNVEYHVLAGLTVFGGVRALWEQQHMTLQHLADDNTAVNFFDQADPYGKLDVHDTQHAIIHKIGLKYNFGPVMIYGTESTGFKGVSWDNYGLSSRAAAAQPLRPEKPHQWEVGMRGKLFHDRFNWQISAFDLIDRDFQARTIERNPRFQLAVVDAKTARTKGIEAGSNLTVMHGLRVGGAYTWLPVAKLTDDVEIPNGPGKFISYQGARLPNAPRSAWNFYGDYSFNFPGQDMKSNIRLEYRHRSSQQSLLTQDPLEIVHAYSILDGYYTIAPRNSRWEMTVFVNNILNKLYYQRSYEPAVLGFDTGQMAYLPRDYKRYFGGSFIYKF